LKQVTTLQHKLEMASVTFRIVMVILAMLGLIGNGIIGIRKETMIEFFVAGIPVSQGSLTHNKQGFGYYANDIQLKAWRKSIAYAAKQLCKVPLEEDVTLYLIFTLPKGKTVKRQFPTVRPDLDKLVRAVGDSLTGIAYVDDSQVTALIANKRYENLLWDCGVHIYIGTDRDGERNPVSSQVNS
jgi:Holliday junction resolvase RusA-like endonuclease